MNKLWVRLTATFGLVTLVGVLTVGWLATGWVSTDFRSFVVQSQVQDTLIPQLVAYYSAHGEWAGVAQVFAAGGSGSPGMGRGAFVLTDAQGRVVYDGPGGGAGMGGPGMGSPALSSAASLPIRWQGQTVGYLGLRGGSALPALAEGVLAQITQALWQAGLIAGLLGLGLGGLLARGIAAPLRRLAAAAGQIARGDLDERVPVQGATEVAALAGAFNDMAAALQAAERARQALIADVAHELRTPLSVLDGNLQAILDDIYPLDKAEITTLLEETAVLRRLVADLHELAQAEAGRLPLTLRPLALGALLEQTATLFAEPAAAQGLTLTCTVPPTLPPVAADAGRVQQVLHNLLGNALAYTPAGGQVQVAADSTAGPGFVRVSIRDTGPGIAAADLPHVFERFWRGDRSRARARGGAGLGLAIARQWIIAQGGQIGVESTLGQGRCFWFTLPTSAASGPAALVGVESRA
jgi:two-component system OmpR family sensor kinase/two-component system sensor histidine kinase BaeS